MRCDWCHKPAIRERVEEHGATLILVAECDDHADPDADKNSRAREHTLTPISGEEESVGTVRRATTFKGEGLPVASEPNTGGAGIGRPLHLLPA